MRPLSNTLSSSLVFNPVMPGFPGVPASNHMVMEWSKLYSNENNEHLPYEDFLALNEAALTIPVTEWLYLGRNQPFIPRQNQIPGKHFVES